MLGKKFRRRHFKIFFLFFIRRLYDWSVRTNFLVKQNKKNIISLSSAEFVHNMVSVMEAEDGKYRNSESQYQPVPCLIRAPYMRRYVLQYKDQTWFSCINIRQVPWEVLKTEAEGLGFQHLPRNLANVYALKNHVMSLLLHKNWKHLLHFALFLALFCFAFSPMSRERNFHWLCSF